ncbi:MAG: LuxR C-terminal-related transcriptional regulator [Velocimicrobium sp.]
MNVYIKRAIGLLMFMFFLCFVLNVNLEKLISPKYLVLVTVGSVLFAGTNSKRKFKTKEFLYEIGDQAIFVSALVSFLSLFMCFSSTIDSVNIRMQVIMCMRPILYGFVMKLLFHVPIEKEEEGGTTEVEVEKKSLHDILIKNGLTKRECEVAILILDNLSNQEIADELYLTENTVKKHNANIYRKLGLANREQLKVKILNLK